MLSTENLLLIQLAYALEDDTMMIEADVSAGDDGQPIMAHPPDTQSDLSLTLFLETVIQATESGTKKGVKLDFKSLDILQPSLETLRQFQSRLMFPVWLNADILPGPSGGPPVEAAVFLRLCTSQFPSATLSTGFTTGSGLGQYSTQMLEELHFTLIEAGVTAPVTVPLRASLAARSREEILSYLEMVDQDDTYPATITLWSGSQDSVDMEQLYRLVREVGRDRVYVDVPFPYDPPVRTDKSLNGFIINCLNSVLSFFSVL